MYRQHKRRNREIVPKIDDFAKWWREPPPTTATARYSWTHTCFRLPFFSFLNFNSQQKKKRLVPLIWLISLFDFVSIIIWFLAAEKITEVGWYVLGEDQQQIGPYAFSELRGEWVLWYSFFYLWMNKSGVEWSGARVRYLGIVYFDFWCLFPN